jgi:hypothetical protein
MAVSKKSLSSVLLVAALMVLTAACAAAMTPSNSNAQALYNRGVQLHPKTTSKHLIQRQYQPTRFLSWLWETISKWFFNSANQQQGVTVLNPVYKLGLLEGFFKAKESAPSLLMTFGTILYSLIGFIAG